MDSSEYRKLSPEQKLAQWRAYHPTTPEDKRFRRNAIRQFMAKIREQQK